MIVFVCMGLRRLTYLTLTLMDRSWTHLSDSLFVSAIRSQCTSNIAILLTDSYLGRPTEQVTLCLAKRSACLAEQSIQLGNLNRRKKEAWRRVTRQAFCLAYSYRWERFPCAFGKCIDSHYPASTGRPREEISSRACEEAMGRTIVKAAPASLSTRTPPPCASTALLTIASPNPAPGSSSLPPPR